MKTVYSKPNCPGCDKIKSLYKLEGIEYKEMVIGKDISLEDFLAFFPEAKSVPYVVET